MKYFLFITLTDSILEQDIVHKLVLRGYDVSAGSGNGNISLIYDNSPSVVMTFILDKRDDGEINQRDIFADAQTILSELEANYYSIVITTIDHQAKWCGSNIQVSGFPVNSKKEKRSN